jgi:hypothetical protein
MSADSGRVHQTEEKGDAHQTNALSPPIEYCQLIMYLTERHTQNLKRRISKVGAGWHGSVTQMATFFLSFSIQKCERLMRLGVLKLRLGTTNYAALIQQIELARPSVQITGEAAFEKKHVILIKCNSCHRAGDGWMTSLRQRIPMSH